MHQRDNEEEKLSFEEEKIILSENLKFVLSKLKLEAAHSFEMFSSVGGNWINITFTDSKAANRFSKVFTAMERPKVMVLHDGSSFCNLHQASLEKAYNKLFTNRHPDIENKAIRPYNEYLLDRSGPGYIGDIIF
ncbi:MAG: hypothetical protein K0R73_161 [Candidatus Midichloriaceae bacterium]|jgi:hypothetical protein|nr:hypothetical protein [Candidatus Midichloriaceae bacterium]